MRSKTYLNDLLAVEEQKILLLTCKATDFQTVLFNRVRWAVNKEKLRDRLYTCETLTDKDDLRDLNEMLRESGV